MPEDRGRVCYDAGHGRTAMGRPRFGQRGAHLLWLCALLAAGACNGGGDDDSADGPPPAQTNRDLVYAGTADGVELAGDLFLPAGAAAPPVVLLVHGGGFFEGSRNELEPIAVELQAQGIASFTVDYRLVSADGGEFPGSSVDVRDAVRFLRASAGRYGLGEVCGTWGSSAGGTLAALASLTVDDPPMARAGWRDLHGYSDTAPVLATAYAVFDFTTREEEHGYVPGPEENWLGGVPTELPQRYAYASPISHVDATDGPVLILQGEADGLVPPSQATAMMQALQAAGVPVELHAYPGAEHGFMFPLNAANIAGLDALERSVEFLVAQCGNPGAVPAGDRTVLQTGEASWDGSSWTGTETYVLEDSSGTATCSLTYETTGSANDDGNPEVTYTVTDEQGDCGEAPYAPDTGATWIYLLGTDTRDGADALLRDVDGLGHFRWFDLTRDDPQLTYGLTQILPP